MQVLGETPEWQTVHGGMRRLDKTQTHDMPIIISARLPNCCRMVGLEIFYLTSAATREP